jgi:hypothetical protein
VKSKVQIFWTQAILWGQLVDEAKVLLDPYGDDTLHGFEVYLIEVSIQKENYI